MKIKTFPLIVCLQLLLALSFSLFAQDLTVRQIMADPSLAGMRPEAERLSPDGKKVVFMWNESGKDPKNLYLWNGIGDAKVILRPSDLGPSAAGGDGGRVGNPLSYGVTVRDEFSRRGAGGIGNLDWSPDSKKILFSQSGDLWVMDITNNESASEDNVLRNWKNVETTLIRLTDLVPVLVNAVKQAGVQEPDIFLKIADLRSKLLSSLQAAGVRTASQRQDILRTGQALASAAGSLVKLDEKYPALRSNQLFKASSDEVQGVSNRITAVRSDFDSVLKAASPNIKRLTKTQSPEVFARWLDNRRIAFSQSGNIFVIDTEGFSLIQLTREANPAAFISVQNSVASKDGSVMAYVVSDSSKQRPLVVPNYLDEFVQAQPTRRGFSTDQKVFVTKTDGSTERVFEIKLPKPEGVGYVRGLDWAADNSSLIVDRIDKDLKHRQLFYVFHAGGKDEQIITITDETDDKWIAPLSRMVEPNPKDNGTLMFASEKDGFNHLYLATLPRRAAEPNPTGERRQENVSDPGFTGAVKIEQLTKGNFEVDWAKWQSDGEAVFYSSTEDSPAIREFYAIYPGRNAQKVRINTAAGGMKGSAQIADTGANPMMLYSGSQWNKPTELFIVKICPNCRGMSYPDRVTNSTPEAFGKMTWLEPKFIDIPSKDGKVIKSKIYLPPGHTPASAGKYPMVIFVHGAGYLQNTINGWNNYYREFMFNEMLAQKGYVVLDIDYRGSAGYGRDWRTDVYDFLGGPDMQDHVDAIDFMVKNYGVEQKKIGVYGGSYGGFMAEMLAMRAPDKIAAAAALRPVADWKNYFASSPIYTAERLGFPDKNPEAYKRSSPIAYADKLERPLLILHGLQDDNVHAQDSIQLAEKLIRLGKTEYFEIMLYPAESHSFTRPESWTDEYTRILTFFEKHLK